MDKIVLSICGLWFWMTRRRRVTAYSDAAATLELAHAYLLRDFYCRASTRDRGILLPHQTEALSILQNHAIDTYVAATRFSSLGECYRLVTDELSRFNSPPVRPTPVPVPSVSMDPPKPAVVRIRFAPARIFRFDILGIGRVPGLSRFLSAEGSGAPWKRSAWRAHDAEPPLRAAPAEQQLPLKAA
ncbi:MAG TPA: hypothetical protein VHU44_02495 [Acidobacteriaceae bacterium]|jgi:hypothetical protein|nr:hypothetical protein [Acidobacteriaceae bacterium]